MSQAEHRKRERIPVSLEVKYCDGDRCFVPYQRAELLDIHQQGCRLLGSTDFKRGSAVSIMVHLPSEGVVRMEGVAAWSAPVYQDRMVETGVRFQMDEYDAEPVVAFFPKTY